jgi:hypothetical protein
MDFKRLTMISIIVVGATLLTYNALDAVVPTPKPKTAAQIWIDEATIAIDSMRRCVFEVNIDIMMADGRACHLAYKQFDYLAKRSEEVSLQATAEEYKIMLGQIQTLTGGMVAINTILDIENDLKRLDEKEFPGEVK